MYIIPCSKRPGLVIALCICYDQGSKKAEHLLLLCCGRISIAMFTGEKPVTEQTLETVERGSFLEVLGIFTRLGLTSFGGPVAHLGYFRQELVVRRKWVDETTYADLIALSQLLPGPASSQVAITLGITRAGLWGGLAAWLVFTLPSAIALTLFAYATTLGQGFTHAGWIHGLLVVAVAVVAQSVCGMSNRLFPDR